MNLLRHDLTRATKNYEMLYSETSEKRTPTGLKKKLSVIKRCPLLGGSLTKIVTLSTKHFVRCSMYVRYLGCPLLGVFTV